MDSLTGKLIGVLGTNGSLVIVFVGTIVAFFLLKKVIRIIFNYMWIAAAGASFPFVANYIGFSINASITSMTKYAEIAVILYTVYIASKFIYSLFRKTTHFKKSSD